MYLVFVFIIIFIYGSINGDWDRSDRAHKDLTELGIGHNHIHLGLGLGIGLTELGIGLRSKNASALSWPVYPALLVSDTRLYILPCWSSHLSFVSGFRITALAQSSATVLSCIWPCFWK